MKQILLLLLISCRMFAVTAQGNFITTHGTNLKTSPATYLVLNNLNVIHNSSGFFKYNDGIMKFTGDANVNIFGVDQNDFTRLVISKTAGSEIKLQCTISIRSELNFQGGYLNLDQHRVILGNTGSLTNESENSRAYTYGNGVIVAAGVLNNPFSVNLGNLGAIITSTKNLGTTWIYRGHKVQQNIYGSNHSILRYYDIIPTNNTGLKATLRFYYFDAELNGINETTLIQWQKKNLNTWNYVGADSKDPAANYTERKNISKFALWTLAMDTVAAVAGRMLHAKEKLNNTSRFSVKVIPNPTTHSFLLFVQTANMFETIMLRIINASGSLIEAKSNIKANQSIQLGENYNPGVYFVEAIQGENRKVIKLIKL